MKGKMLWAAIMSAALLAGCAATPAPATPTPPVEVPVPAVSAPAEEPSPTPAEDLAPTPETLALDYLTEEYGQRAYTAANAPGQPEKSDLRLDGMTWLGEEPVYETVGVAYELAFSWYMSSRDETGELVYAWTAMHPVCLVLQRGGDGSWLGMFGRNYRKEGESTEELILRTAWGLMDAQVSLRQDGSSQLMGPGGEGRFLFGSEEPTITVIPDGEPIYHAGDQWVLCEYEDFTARCYLHAAEDRMGANRIETTRTDLATYRGIRVGDSREAALAAYPELRDGPYWDYEGDYLWYNRDEMGFGPALLFWFEDDTVVKLELIDMFD